MRIYMFIAGAVPGLIGTLQALEALKIIIDLKPSLSERLLLLDAQTASFRCVKLRAKQAGCAVCSPQRSINDVADVDYAVFCGRLPNDKVNSLIIFSVYHLLLNAFWGVRLVMGWKVDSGQGIGQSSPRKARDFYCVCARISISLSCFLLSFMG